MRQLSYTILLTLTAAALATGCKRNDREKIDISTIHTTAAETETMAEDKETEEPVSIAPETTAAPTKENTASVNSTATKLTSYKSGSVTIEYPEVYDTGDTGREASINKLIKDNALSIITAYGTDEAKDTLSIKCQVVAADRKRLTLVYTGSYNASGAAYPTNVFYTNTIDLNKIASIRLNDFADPYTMAGYVLSGDCQFTDVTDAQRTELMKVKNDTSLDAYTQMFTKADFPVEGDFPQTFSYEQQGSIYFSIPVPHAVGDYAVVKYTPDTK